MLTKPKFRPNFCIFGLVASFDLSDLQSDLFQNYLKARYNLLTVSYPELNGLNSGDDQYEVSKVDISKGTEAKKLAFIWPL